MISVLYVDDEPLFLDIGRRFLERSGKLSVDTFLSADIAVRLIPFTRYDAIISDYQMPDMDGIAFLSEVRKIDPNIPFIVYTGQGREDVAIQALNKGADLYLQKGGTPMMQYGEMENFILNIVAREQQKGEIIHEKRKAEEALSLLQSLYEYAPFGFAFVDHDFVFIHLNDALASLCGLPRTEYLGRSMESVVPGLWNAVRHHITKVPRTGSPELAIEVPGAAISGSDQTKNWLMNFYPVRTKGGTYLGTGILIIDNTSRKTMEQALARSEERYRTLAESAEDGIFIISRDERVSYINPYGLHILDLQEDTLTGADICESGGLVDQLIQQSQVRAVFETGKMCSYDAEIRASDHQRWVEVLLIPMPGYRTPAGQVMGIGRDITRRKRAESGLLNANRKLGLLSSITRHDIINQLSFLFIFLDRLEQYTKGDPSGLEDFQLIRQSVETIHEQIEFTREYQEIGVGAPLWQNLHEVIDRSRRLLPMKEVLIEEINTDGEVYADSLFTKVVYNLLENAIRYGEKISVIRWSVIATGESCTIIVEDDGVGIPNLEKEEIFSFGFGKHTGFGLFMVREVLSITNIAITETGTPGAGARFELSVPPGGYRPTQP